MSTTQEAAIPESLDVLEIPALEAKEPDETASVVSPSVQDDTAAQALPRDEINTKTAEIPVKSENMTPPAVTPTIPKEATQPDDSKKDAAKLQDSLATPPAFDVKNVKPKETEKKPVETEILKPAEKKSSSEQKKPKALPAWELRSASTGSAVIHDKSTGNVLSIGVGSTVNGIGRVKSIEKHDGKWRVTGTMGSIRQ